MKKTLLSVYIFLLSIMAVMAQEGEYQIEGQLGPAINEQLVLVAETEKGAIELGQITVENGSFRFTGSRPGVTVVHLMPAKKDAVLATLMLENARYTISLGTDGWVVEGGGEAQQIWNEFHGLQSALAQKQKQLEAQARAGANAMQMQALQREAQKIMTGAQQQETELSGKYATSIVTAYVLASGMQGMDETVLSERYELLGESAKATWYGKRIAANLAKLQATAIGAVAPEFSAPLADGSVLSLHETKAKVKVIDFWASWCQPCRRENVNLLSLYKHYRPKGLEIISVSLDEDKKAWTRAIGEDGCYWQCVCDLKGAASAIAAEYGVKAIPYTLVLDEENRIVAKNLRGKELENKIGEMLKKKK